MITVKRRKFSGMKKAVTLFFILSSASFFAQTKYTAEQVEKSSDPQVIANFIKNNPDHPKTPFFRQKLASIVLNGNDAAKPKIEPTSKEKLASNVKKDIRSGNTDAHTKKTVDMLNHLFSNDPNKREAYVVIENKSKCNLIIKFAGKKYYNLDVKAHDQNYILIDKGTYTLTTNVCDAKYSSTKNIRQDIVITLK
ncbi:hypothetical protein IMZ16_08075 [Cruoricaptor ignavus]|uniref:DUF6759 domain-containing protein n=1 Tax=Cruoricaptor ignavus TaxID=1118202 RepID=A0A7M1T108_9FLAO|nr:DUF6759 domain-containing protein [Cruoricaptor ignavus]QOR73475.1 hypothetical protein IMZ16_08075 [Cruoricaptor ignavus]